MRSNFSSCANRSPSSPSPATRTSNPFAVRVFSNAVRRNLESSINSTRALISFSFILWLIQPVGVVSENPLVHEPGQTVCQPLFEHGELIFGHRGKADPDMAFAVRIHYLAAGMDGRGASRKPELER